MSTEIISIKDVNSYYGTKHILKNINMDIRQNSVTAFIGPSACGKSTLLRSLNRMNDLISSFKITGSIEIDNIDIYKDLKKSSELMKLRQKVGMVFQQPNPLPISVMKNLTMPIEENFENITSHDIKEKAIKCLKDVQLYDEIQERLNQKATRLSGGQQQRLCIARCLTINPEVILFDEPCSALDPISTMKIEELINDLKKDYTIVIVTHNLEQARRISDKVGFFYQGELVEYGESEQVFMEPQKDLTRNYISGKF